jgi:hypothetical protein
MKTLNSFGLIIGISFLSMNQVMSQSSVDDYWQSISEITIEKTGKRQIIPQKYLTVKLNGLLLKNKLKSAPYERQKAINLSDCIITLPLPNGTTQKFKVVESPIMSVELANAYPDIKTYSIKGVDDVYANGKLDWNEFGFHAMVRSINGDFFIDPYCVGNTSHYTSYYTSDFIKNPSDIAPELNLQVKLKEQAVELNSHKKELKTSAIPSACTGNQLSTYRLVVACTGEYAVAATGLPAPTVAQTLAKIVTSINRVDGVYETELAVRMVLIPTETLVIFTNGNSDPFTGNFDGFTLINEIHPYLINTIGTANFDIGHIFSTGGGGIASFQAVCNPAFKGEGVTGLANPVGDPYDIDYVSHEMGHQFGANHPFNCITGGCNGTRNPATAVEPGSGVTVMSYAGLCGANNLAANSIAYFHAISYDEITQYVTLGGGNVCSVVTASGNQPPVVVGSGNYIVPKSTPFILAGSATDPDGDALTFSWEETDIGSINGSNWNSGTKPFFRSYAPTAAPSRSFPINTVALSGNFTGTKGEYLPNTPQVLEFRLTARDNKMGGGGVCYAIDTVTVDDSGPLAVTYPSDSDIEWTSGTQQTITWDVNNTDINPVNCTNVRIYISYDSGTTYSILINSTLNDGTQLINVPTVTTTIGSCRIKVESLGNIFYDVGDNNFTISNSVGIAEVSQNNPFSITVWPNPFSHQFNVSATNLIAKSETQLNVTDVLGRVVYDASYIDKIELKENVNLKQLSKGIYFLKIVNDNKQAVYRIVKD